MISKNNIIYLKFKSGKKAFLKYIVYKSLRVKIFSILKNRKSMKIEFKILNQNFSKLII